MRLNSLVNVLGGHGFIGSYFTKTYKCVVNERNDLIPKLDGVTDVLFLISTVDNYSVKINPFLDIETNLTTLIRVLENFRNLNRPDVVFNFASSWFVYGNTDLPAKETSHCDPKGFYSITKRAAEQLLISYCDTYKLKYRILRFANVVGLGDNKVSKKKNALTYLLNEIKFGRPIDLYDGGCFTRDFIHVEDLCFAVKLIMEKGNSNKIFNVGNGKAILFKDVIEYARETYNSLSNIKTIEQPEFHKLVQVKNMYMDNTQLKELGYLSKHSIYSFVDEVARI